MDEWLVCKLVMLRHETSIEHYATCLYLFKRLWCVHGPRSELDPCHAGVEITKPFAQDFTPF